MLGGAFAAMRKLLFLGGLLELLPLSRRRIYWGLLGTHLRCFTGGGRSALYWGLLGCAESNFAF